MAGLPVTRLSSILLARTTRKPLATKRAKPGPVVAMVLAPAHVSFSRVALRRASRQIPTASINSGMWSVPLLLFLRRPLRRLLKVVVFESQHQLDECRWIFWMVVEFLDGFSHIINVTAIKASVFVGERKIWGLIVSMSTFHVLSLQSSLLIV